MAMATTPPSPHTRDAMIYGLITRINRLLLRRAQPPDRRAIPAAHTQKKGEPQGSPLFNLVGSPIDQKSLAYASLPTKPILVTLARLVCASTASTISYRAACAGRMCNSG